MIDNNLKLSLIPRNRLARVQTNFEVEVQNLKLKTHPLKPRQNHTNMSVLTEFTRRWV